jgi:hypothetical protein
VVGYKPVSVFDVAQTEGELLPDLETAATGEAGDLLDRLLESSISSEMTVRVLEPGEWSHDAADGVCRWPDGPAGDPVIEVRERTEEAATAGTLLHELAHARIHAGVESAYGRTKREVEAEAVAYVVGREFGLNTSNSAFYLAAWQGDDRDVLSDRLARISSTAEEFIETIEA